VVFPLRKSRIIATRPARASITSAYDGVTVAKTDVSKLSFSVPVSARPRGWKGCSIPTTPGLRDRKPEPWHGQTSRSRRADVTRSRFFAA
jgi:hypothetical protein